MNQAQQHIRQELSKLIEEQGKLMDLGKDVKDTIAFGTEYQHWYTRALKIVEALAPDRLDEFVDYYRVNPKRREMHAGNYTIQDYVMGYGPMPDCTGKLPYDPANLACVRVLNQIQILASLSTRIGTVLSDVRGHLFTELQDAELQAAEQLTKINLRAAGALAGVILERHLQRAALNHKLTIAKRDPTVADLNDPLKQAGVYDIPTWRKIQLLADIRNLCSHQKSTEPSKEQVTELIAGVNSIIKTVF
jgi:hypothetical protein